MVYRFRVILDAKEDVFRDVEILQENTLEDLHNTILQSFGFDGTEMASFYLSDEDWQQGEEFSQFDMGGEVRLMNETSLESILDEDHRKLIYIYDFLKMWTFLIELAQVGEIEDGRDYPNLMFVHGQLPDEAPDKDFIGEDDEDAGGGDMFHQGFNTNDYDDLSFDENWN
jgi:hypothetical protein